MDSALKNFFNGQKAGRIFHYNEFINISIEKINSADEKTLKDKELKYHNYRKINLQRTNRINKTFKPNNEIVELVKNITKNQFWLIITEDWCGDSAQNLPYIVNYLKMNPLINFRVILRDDNLEAIDNYFKEGNPRSIPKIVIFNEEGEELFVWGPRPKFAQDLVSQLKSEGYTRDEFNKELHTWYAKNNGKELEKELVFLFKQITNNLKLNHFFASVN